MDGIYGQGKIRTPSKLSKLSKPSKLSKLSKPSKLDVGATESATTLKP